MNSKCDDLLQSCDELRRIDHALFLVRECAKRLEVEISANNDYLRKNARVLSEKMESERQAQRQRLMKLSSAKRKEATLIELRQGAYQKAIDLI
jgi:hypothetical protein